MFLLHGKDWLGVSISGTIATMKKSIVISMISGLYLCLAGSAQARSPWLPQSNISQPGSPSSSQQKGQLKPKEHENLSKALNYLDKGKYNKALPLLDSVLEAQAYCTAALRARARTLLTLGYLKWTHPMVQQAIKDTEAFLWIDYNDLAMKDMLALLRQLDKRMKYIDSARKARASRKRHTGT